MGLSLLATTDTQIIRVVEALYNQRPGYTFLSNFKTYVTENSIDALANSLAGNFATSSDAELAAVVTANLGLTGEALAAGNAYLEGQFAAYPAARGKVILDAMNILATMESDPVFGAVAATFNADTIASLTYSSVATNTTVTTSDAAADVVAGQTFALTTSTDSITGTSGNDTINAVLQGDGAAGTTVAPGDSISGGEGDDTLNISVAGNPNDYTLSALQTTGVETLSISNFDTTDNNNPDLIVDATLMTGLTTVALTSSAHGDTQVSNLKNIVDAQMTNGSGDLTVAYQASVVTGTTDSQNLTLSNVTAGNFTAANVETVSIASNTTANTLTTLTAAAATTLNLSGDANLTITDELNATNAAIKTITSTMTGNLTIENDSTTVTATLGAGDDVYKTGAAVADTYSIDAGDGEDELSVTASTVLDTALEAARYTNFEALQINNIDDATAELSQDMSLLDSNIDTVTIVTTADGDDGTNAAATMTTALTNAAADMTLKFEGMTNTNTTVSNDVDVAASVAVASDSDADNLNVVLGTATAASGTTLSSGASNDVELTLTTSNSETVSILSQGGANFIESLDAADLTTLTVTGDKSLTIEALTNTTLLANIDAAGMTGTAALVMGTNASTTASTITGTANADTLTGGTKADTINGGAGVDTIDGISGANTINGGAGNDIITSGSDADTINGGEGDDTINIAANELTADDTIDGGAGTDKIKLSAAGTVADVDFTGVTNVETLTMADAATTLTFGAEVAESGIATVDYTDTPVAGKTNSLTLGATYTTDATIKLGANGDTVDASDYTGTLDVEIAANSIGSTDVLTGGTGTSTLEITASGTAITASELANVTKFDVFKIANNLTTNTITLADANIDASGALTVDGTALTGTSTVLTVVGTNETNGTLTVLGGAGDDVITGTASTSGDVLNGNAGNDTFNFATANFTSADTVDGGAGTTDTINISDAATVVDADFTNVTNVEKLTATSTLSLTIGDVAQAAALESITATGALTLTIDAEYTSNLTLALAANNDTVTGTAYTGDLAITYAADNLTTADTLIGGTGTNDSITVSGAVSLTASELANVTKFEKIVIGTDAGAAVTLADVNTDSGKSMTIDASALVSTNALTFDGALETNGQVTVIGGSHNDGITATASSMGDILNGNAGNDTFTFASANFNSSDTVSGGAGTDIITFSDAATVADSDFTNVTSVETLTLASTTSVTVLGALAAATGIVTVNAGSSTSNALTLGSGFTNNVTVALVDNADTITATEYTGALTITISEDEDLTGADTITGGTGSDTLTVIFDTDGTDTLTATEMAGVTKIETFKLGSNVAGDLTLHDNNIAADAAMTINATAATSAAMTFDGSAELDGSITYNGGAGVDTVTGTAKNDTINGNAGADVLAGYLGADTLTGGLGADAFAFTAAVQSNSVNTDSITDFVSGTDTLNFTLDLSAQSSSVTFDATVQTAVAGKEAAENALSGSVGQVIYDTTNSVVYVNANADTNISTLDYQVGVNAASTAANTIAAGDVNFTITGGSAGDIIVAGAGVDVITGGDGGDTITGGTGNDYLKADTSGDNDIDTVTGGAGNDTFVWSDAGEADIFVEAASGGTDTILFTDALSLAGLKFGVTSAAAAANASLAQIEQLVVDTGTTGTVLSQQVTGLTLAVNELAAGTADLAITVANDGDLDISNFTFATFDYIDSTGTSVAGDAFDDGVDTITITGQGDNTITGSSVKDTIDVVEGANTVTGGLGADDMTGGAGVDQFIIANADTGNTVATADIIREFTTTADKIDLAGAGGGANYSEDDGNVVDFAAALAQADTELNGTVLYSFQTDGTNGWLFYDADGVANATTALDAVVSLIGIDDDGIAAGDIIA